MDNICLAIVFGTTLIAPYFTLRISEEEDFYKRRRLVKIYMCLIVLFFMAWFCGILRMKN